MNTTKTKKAKRNLVCELSESQRLEYGKELALQFSKKLRVEAEKKQSMDAFKNRIGGIESQIADLSQKVETGQEWRDVPCEWRFGQPTKKTKQLVRLDTEEVVSTEDMTADDMQEWLGGAPEFEPGEDDEEPRRANGRVIDAEPLGLPMASDECGEDAQEPDDARDEESE